MNHTNIHLQPCGGRFAKHKFPTLSRPFSCYFAEESVRREGEESSFPLALLSLSHHLSPAHSPSTRHKSLRKQVSLCIVS